MRGSSTIYKTNLNKFVGGVFCERTTGDGFFSFFYWRKCYYGLQTHILSTSDSLLLNGFVLNKQFLASPDIN